MSAAEVEKVFALRQRFWQLAYRPLAVWSPDQRVNDKGEPLNSPGKQPRGRWREDAARDPPEAVRTYPDPRALNTGLLCGDAVAFDVDVLDQELVDNIVHLIETTLGPTPLVRIGRPPKTLLVYRPECRFTKVQTPELFFPDGTKAKVELLAEGQQFVADGIHPDTGEPYRWTDSSPAEVRLAELPVVTEERARQIIAEAEHLLRTAGGNEKEKPSREQRKSNGAAGDLFSQVNTAALADIAAWARSLFPLARFEPSTGAWRISSKDLGRNLEEDISIHPEGIWDFGEEIPLTAIDIVMQHGGQGTAADAAVWLCNRLGIDPVSLGYRGKLQSDSAEDKEDKATRDLGVCNAGDIDIRKIPPREWLLGNTFCKGFLSGLFAQGGVGKSAVRLVQILAVVTGRPLTREHVFGRSRALIVCLEDTKAEFERRLMAAMIHHRISPEDIRDKLFYWVPTGMKLARMSETGSHKVVPDELEVQLRNLIAAHQIDLITLDPFIKLHAVEENDNTAIDQVCIILSRIMADLNCAIDTPHHDPKGLKDPGDSNRGRGASSLRDGGRLFYTLTSMTEAEREQFKLTESERRLLVRIDSAKVNISPPSAETRWFKLVGVRLGNATDAYPRGDEVQTVEPWTPPDMWKELTISIINQILDRIEKGPKPGQFYSPAPNAGPDRRAWPVVQEFCPNFSDKQAKDVIKTWITNGVFKIENRDDEDRKPRPSLIVGTRPGDTWNS